MLILSSRFQGYTKCRQLGPMEDRDRDRYLLGPDPGNRYPVHAGIATMATGEQSAGGGREVDSTHQGCQGPRHRSVCPEGFHGDGGERQTRNELGAQ